MNDARANSRRMPLLIGRLVLASIFLVAAYAKLKPQAAMPWSVASVKTSLAMFAMGVDSYEMLPAWAVSPVAHFVPIFELVLGLWLLSGIALRFSSVISTLAIIGFMVAMLSAYERGLTISCGCFGPGEQVGPKTLIRDGLLYLPLTLAVSVGAFWIRRNRSAGLPAPGSAPQRAN
jgi:uncharacterized membrane protein YphA (DoxX/SURF4 family)